MSEAETSKTEALVNETPRELEEPFMVADNVLNAYEFRQEGRMLVCVDNPNLTALLPTGVYLEGERGNYKLKRLF